jgi:hypothetical protein
VKKSIYFFVAWNVRTFGPSFDMQRAEHETLHKKHKLMLDVH